jgi:ADP-dependent NAD(P)H-hydrate dehydratase / NAD(P)H-hydrate epimerase
VKPLLTPHEMRAADERAVLAGTSVATLMERAGRAVARAVRGELGGTYGRRVVVVCGRGNNGGDGLVAARVLRAWGVRVDVFRLERGLDRPTCARALARADVVVDAMFGTGFRGVLEGDAAWFAERTASATCGRVAVDIPSGVSGLDGAVEGVAVCADRTVCFGAYKPGVLFEPGRSHAGVVEVVDIGLDVCSGDGSEPEVPRVGVISETDVVRWLPDRGPDAHKWSAGGVFVVGGSSGMTGAPMMVSHAAMRVGAGIVWCGMPGDAAARASGSEVVTRLLPAATDGALGADAAIAVLAELERFRVLVLGPGLGSGSATRAAVQRIVAEAPIALVLDADGLNALEGDLSPLRARAVRGVPTILTPHAAEYARLAGRPVGPDRMVAARELAAAAQSVVLLKGPGTVITDPDGRLGVNPTGGPWLATAGSGDVLSGMVGGLAARGAGGFESAAAGAWLHGRAADVAGHTGLVAGDLVAAIPATLRTVGDRVPKT